MKVKHKELEEYVFQPIEVTVTIESRAELVNLVARLNLAAACVNERGGKKGANNSDTPLFNVLDSILEELP